MANLLQAIEYASKNPNSDFAMFLSAKIKTGQADEEARQLGIDLTPIKSGIPDNPNISQAQPQQEGMVKGLIKDVASLVTKPAVRFGQLVGTGLTKAFGTQEQYQKALDYTKQPTTLDFFGSAEKGGLGPMTVGGVQEGAAGYREAASDALKTAAYVFPFERAAGILGKVVGPTAGKIASGALGGYAFDVAQNLPEAQTAGEALTPGLGTAIGGGIPAVGATGRMLVRFGEKQAPRVINSLIKPLAKDFSYGKNPGRAVAEEKIVANNFEDLATKINERRSSIGQQIDSLGKKTGEKVKLSLGDSLAPIDNAISEAASSNNQTLLNRLQNVKRAITDELGVAYDESGNAIISSRGKRVLDNLSVQQAREIKTLIGDMTAFTGNPSDDKLVNSALKRVYGSIKGKINEGVSKFDKNLGQQIMKLNEKYADLLSAEIATKYRGQIAERSNLVGLSPAISGFGTALLTAIATGGAAIPAILAGGSGVIVDKLASTPAFKTRLAAVLSKTSPEQYTSILQKLPWLDDVVTKALKGKKLVSPGESLIRSTEERLGKINPATKQGGFIKNP